MQNCPEMEIVEILEGSSNMMQGQKRIEDALDRNEDVDGIFCAEGITSYAALKVMQERSGEASRIPVTVYEYGEVLAKGLENGYISTAIVQAPCRWEKWLSRYWRLIWKTGLFRKKTFLQIQNYFGGIILRRAKIL